ncbi:kxDL motif-containing protein CG10681-like [Portunus trituberculatus]|uniref:kxDL motif-containing protein CG10681-like n=1 Tax=Portunus trituberculatus TaxID=210409 RepID=UPI001E1CFBD6|nr:kxDL motif-containing protein CG10681-like [Portunus trituberculatus]
MAASSPDSDLGSIDCFQNYTAPEVFVQGLAGQINQQDVEAIIRAQKQMLQRFEKTNEMLSNCNSLSATRFALAQKEFKKHTALLVDMKKDLDNIFKRIRTIKTKLSNQYPAAFAVAQEEAYKEEEEEEEEKPSTNQNSTLSREDSVKRTSVSGESGHSSNKSERMEEMEQSSDGSRPDAERRMKKTASSSSDSSSSGAKLSSSSSFDN